MFSMKRTSVILLFSTLTMSCASSSFYLEPSPSASTITLVNQEALLGKSGLTCPFVRPLVVCRAYLMGVDNRNVLSMGQQNRINAGSHRIALGCMSYPGTPIFGGHPVIERHLFEGTIGPAATYYVRGEMKDGVCKAWIADAPDGAPVSSLAEI
jgi:hypothetical protein